MRQKTELFYSVFILHLATRELFQFFQESVIPQLAISIAFGLLFLIFQIRKYPKARLIVPIAVLFLLILKLINTFPSCSNHFYVEMLIALFFLLFSTSADPNEQRHRIFQNGVIGLIIFVFTAAGVQKVIAGTYFNTAFIAFKIWDSEIFALNMSYLIPADVARITAGEASQAFRLEQTLGIAMSRLVPILEIMGGLLLLIKRTRMFAFCICVCSLLAIEFIAREFMFGLLYLLCLGLVLESKRFRHWSYMIAGGYMLLAAVHFIFPKFFFN